MLKWYFKYELPPPVKIWHHKPNKIDRVTEKYIFINYSMHLTDQNHRCRSHQRMSYRWRNHQRDESSEEIPESGVSTNKNGISATKLHAIFTNIFYVNMYHYEWIKWQFQMKNVATVLILWCSRELFTLFTIVSKNDYWRMVKIKSMLLLLEILVHRICTRKISQPEIDPKVNAENDEQE